mmetsp:Transcript_18344/g.56043  ORF Transcript_18344/g.56043 Transcript_18344/m.56043 type:complete len:326 (-) Transcript_18344:34-1011(-)
MMSPSAATVVRCAPSTKHSSWLRCGLAPRSTTTSLSTCRVSMMPPRRRMLPSRRVRGVTSTPGALSAASRISSCSSNLKGVRKPMEPRLKQSSGGTAAWPSDENSVDACITSPSPPSVTTKSISPCCASSHSRHSPPSTSSSSCASSTSGVFVSLPLGLPLALPLALSPPLASLPAVFVFPAAPCISSGRSFSALAGSFRISSVASSASSTSGSTTTARSKRRRRNSTSAFTSSRSSGSRFASTSTVCGPRSSSHRCSCSPPLYAVSGAAAASSPPSPTAAPASPGGRSAVARSAAAPSAHHGRGGPTMYEGEQEPGFGLGFGFG